ncbi:MAG: hypothetical protein EOQ64_15460 [Mesorhizobium sp.]|uniref:hypothetical protein n=1 Tax=Mesorhizobium sp. TaxID=1871066 RepID=UPI000FEA8564|nr:hypothetical protein [Mesorhizobium sp.]RWG55860.1 MAG: hypothetical protein EOQ64_15460 [Mesorhizobium sp.]RWH44949.1 MAG: hypothetical protein EOQ78_08435 [Mesorhizobium sp.]RWI26133.1 MAG: hypothetical protein EOQ94_11250 [Mesorhizobium sp.]
MFPTADQIALAIVMACRPHREDPVAVCSGELGMRARHVAMEALIIAFPDARRVGLGKCLAYGTPRSAQGQVIGAKKGKWWSDDHVDEIVGALVAEQYGEQAQ